MAHSEDRGRLGQLAAEFLVIVIGVFVALAAESWWSEREERQFERELLRDMVAEFEQNIRILEQDLAANAESSAHFRSLAELDDSALQAIDNVTMGNRYGVFPSWAGFDPELGAAQALVQSGNLNVISDPELRLMMSEWSGLLVTSRRFTVQATSLPASSCVNSCSCPS